MQGQGGVSHTGMEWGESCKCGVGQAEWGESCRGG